MRTWLKAQFPGLYWRARNGAALAQWCALRLRPVRRENSESDAYDGEFWSFHDGGDWDGFARLILDRFHPQTVWDVGCGDGKLLAALARADAAARLIGFDHSPAARARAAARGVNVQAFDVAKLTPNLIDKAIAEFGPPELTLCLEVAEHLPFWQAGRCLSFLAAAPVVVFSAAQPLQGGVLHVNEQRPEYWMRRFAKLGYEHDPDHAGFRSAVQNLSLPAWYGANLQVFRKMLKEVT